jgi:AcrR family transcriptional regulator
VIHTEPIDVYPSGVDAIRGELLEEAPALSVTRLCGTSIGHTAGLAGTQDGKRPRSRKVASDDARKAILDAAASLFCREGFGAVSLEQIAEHAGLHKMSIYRTFGSREALERACAERLCEREKGRWVEIGERFAAQPTQHLIELFNELSKRMLLDGSLACRLHLLSRHFTREATPVRAALAVHRREFRSLLFQISIAAQATDPDGLADTLTLLWEGVTLELRSRRESQHVAHRLPALATHIIHTYERRS